MKALSRVSFGCDNMAESVVPPSLESWVGCSRGTGAFSLSVAPRVTEDTQRGKPNILR